MGESVLKDWYIIVLLGVTIILYARIFLQDPASSGGGKALQKEFEQTFDTFAAQLEEENQQILDHIIRLKNGYEAEIAKLEGRIERLEKQIDSIGQSALRAPAPPMTAPVTDDATPHTAPLPNPALTPPVPAQSSVKLDHTQASVTNHSSPERQTETGRSIEQRYEQLLRYDREGKSVEWISRHTGIHKGEVQLILKLARQEGTHHA